VQDLGDESGVLATPSDGEIDISKSLSVARATLSGSLKRRKDQKRLKNDAVIICLGGQLPTEFLEAAGVSTRKYLGEEKTGVGQGPKQGLTKAQVEARARRRLAVTLFALGGAIIAFLLLMGQEYYWLPLEERAKSPLHGLLKPSGLWGHGVGVIATTFMMANFLYALRKRWRKLKGTASIRTWLTFHMFVGIMSPLVIAFHAAFLVNNLLAVWTWIALTIVVGTGIFGRFLFSFVPAQAGKMLGVSELREQMNDMNAILDRHVKETTNVVHVTQIVNVAKTAPGEKNLFKAIMSTQNVERRLVSDVEGARQYFKDDNAFRLFRDSVAKIARARFQIAFYATLKRIFRAWLVFHVVVSIFMVVLIAAHVAVTTYLGFTWIFGAH
jgi:dihydropyrimidine dehydrogenase (NAD+) subunit PreT